MIVIVKVALPAATEFGLRLVITGGGCEMVKVNGADAPPAVVTVTLTLPAVATRLAGIITGNAPPTRGAVRGVAPKFATIDEVKLVP